MSVIAGQLQIASMIDTQVNRITKAGGDDLTLLQEETDYMDGFKHLFFITAI
jgi:hypothetical protein